MVRAMEQQTRQSHDTWITRLEHGYDTVENSMGVVHSSEGHLSPASPDLLSEPAIVAGLAKATLGLDWSDYIANYDRI